MSNQQIQHLKAKIHTLTTIQKQVEVWKNDHQKLVFTNGCFDLLHQGHLTYLAEAAGLGNKLIIGVNTDASVCKLKGKNRPVNDEQSRLMMLAALFFVDAVILFDEDTPLNLIKLLMPDVLVKGGDYTIDKIVGADEVISNGGEVKAIPFLPGFSSSKIIEKIQKN